MFHLDELEEVIMLGNVLAYLQLVEIATPLALQVTRTIQNAVPPDTPGAVKLQYVLSTVQSGLQLVSNLTATADQLTPIVNAAVALHKGVGTQGFAQQAAPAPAQNG